MISTATRGKCQAIKSNGEPCQSWAVNGSAFCIVHSPAHAAIVAAARQKGGRARHGRTIGTTGEAAPVKLVELADVLALLSRVADDLYAMENSVSRGRALVSLATAWADCYRTTELERRIAALEAQRDSTTG